jgi:hypothetical protein
MRKTASLLVSASFALLAGCAGGGGGGKSDTTPNAAETPGKVTIELVGVVVAPGKSDGMSWDGVPAVKIPADADAALRKALAEPDGVKKAGAMLSKFVDKGIEPPEPQGTMQVMGASGPVGEAVKLPMKENSFTPQWSAKIEHVKLDPTTKLHIHLEDWDDGAPELIADLDLDAATIKGALAERGKPVDIRVDAKTPHLLAVTIAVRAE